MLNAHSDGQRKPRTIAAAMNRWTWPTNSSYVHGSSRINSAHGHGRTSQYRTAMDATVQRTKNASNDRLYSGDRDWANAGE